MNGYEAKHQQPARQQQQQQQPPPLYLDASPYAPHDDNTPAPSSAVAPSSASLWTDEHCAAAAAALSSQPTLALGSVLADARAAAAAAAAGAPASQHPRSAVEALLETDLCTDAFKARGSLGVIGSDWSARSDDAAGAKDDECGGSGVEDDGGDIDDLLLAFGDCGDGDAPLVDAASATPPSGSEAAVSSTSTSFFTTATASSTSVSPTVTPSLSAGAWGCTPTDAINLSRTSSTQHAKRTSPFPSPSLVPIYTGGGGSTSAATAAAATPAGSGGSGDAKRDGSSYAASSASASSNTGDASAVWGEKVWEQQQQQPAVSADGGEGYYGHARHAQGGYYGKQSGGGNAYGYSQQQQHQASAEDAGPFEASFGNGWFGTFLINGSQVINCTLPHPGCESSATVAADTEAITITDEKGGLGLDVVFLASDDAVPGFEWRGTCVCHFADGTKPKAFYIGSSRVADVPVMLGRYCGAKPVRFTVYVGHVSADVPTQSPPERDLLELLERVLTNPQYNREEGSISSVQMYNIIKESPLYCRVVKDKYDGSWMSFIKTNPELAVFAYSDEEVKACGLGPRFKRGEPRICLSRHTLHAVREADRLACQRYKIGDDVILKTLTETLLESGPSSQRQILNKLRKCKCFTDRLYPTKSLVERFIAQHHPSFVVRYGREQPVRIGLNTAAVEVAA
eukprot:Rhum_TRINITY_DN14616_c11_g1::Rhum_TRINITY_DN14616_c11_g1_i1::g.102331::m.102331